MGQDWANHLLSFQDLNPSNAIMMNLNKQDKSMLMAYISSGL